MSFGGFCRGGLHFVPKYGKMGMSLNGIPISNSLFVLLPSKYQPHQQGGEGGELVHDAPNAEVESDEGLGGLLVKYRSEAVGTQVVVQVVCKGVDGQGQSEGCGG